MLFRSIPSNDGYVEEAFSLTKCFPNPIGCTDDTLDISPFYIASNLRGTIDDAEIIKVCEIAEGVRKLFPNCVDIPTPEPSRSPPVPTYFPIEQPLADKGITSVEPVDAVTGFPSTNPVDVAPSIKGPDVETTLQPTQGQIPTDCKLNLSLADNDADSRLTQQEFLTYVSLQPGCEAITSLSSQQSNTFNNLAALCLNEVDADDLCIQPRNARVSIDGIYDIQTETQRDAILFVCSKTEGICTSSPLPIDTPAPAVLPGVNSPITPQMQLPPLGQPIDAQVPTTNAPNQDRPIVRDNPELPSVGIPAGANSPASEGNFPLDLFPAVSQTSAPLRAPDGEPVAAPSFASSSPPLGVVDTPPVYCINATLESDNNSDSYLSQDEYLTFIQLFSKCDLINILSADQQAVFQNLACTCLHDPAASPDCCLPGNDKIFIEKSPKLSELCFLTASTFDDECVAPPTMTPIEYQDLDQCSNDLVESDADKNDLMDKQEYLSFIQKFGQCEAFQTLDLGHYSVFQTMACECVNQGKSFECCLPGNATLNISGASLQDSNRSEEQVSMLSKICITANGLTTRPCEAFDVSTPKVDCADSLLTADTDTDGFLDMNEYLLFLQATYTNCSGIEWLSLSQRVVFSLLACSCLLEPGAELECCFPENARINISGALAKTSMRTSHQNHFLSTLCTASDAAANIGCRTEIPTSAAPTRNFTEELSYPPAVTKTSEIAVVSPDDKISTSKSQAPELQSMLQATSLIVIVPLMFRLYV